MQRRARSLSRFSYNPLEDDIYERNSYLSTKLPVRRPYIYSALRSQSVGPARYNETPFNFYDGARLRRRAMSVGPYGSSSHYVPLRATTPYRPYSLCDIDFYDRFSERIREPLHSSLWVRPSDTFVTRYLTSIDRMGRINEQMKELDYRRSIRSLRLHTPSNVYRWSSMPWEWLSSARNLVHQEINLRVPGLNKSRINPRDYYGRAYICMERNSVNRVRSRYSYLGKNVEQKPSAWNAEDQIETGESLQKLNDSTLPIIYESQNLVDNSRENLLLDRAGVVPRFHHLSSDFTRTRFTAEHSKRMLNDFKRFKDDTLARISAPWSITQYT